MGVGNKMSKTFYTQLDQIGHDSIPTGNCSEKSTRIRPKMHKVGVRPTKTKQLPNRTRNSSDRNPIGKSNGIPWENVPKFRVHNLTP
jgi:hypothetical protein